MGLLESGMLLFWPFIVVILIVGLLSFFTVQTAQVAVITRFGKFLRVAEPGLNWKWPFIDRVAGRVSLRVNQLTLTMETKTKDNVFVTIPIFVQNRVRPEKVYDAFYKLSDPMQQIQAYVEQVILGYGKLSAKQLISLHKRCERTSSGKQRVSGTAAKWRENASRARACALAKVTTAELPGWGNKV